MDDVFVARGIFDCGRMPGTIFSLSFASFSFAEIPMGKFVGALEVFFGGYFSVSLASAPLYTRTAIPPPKITSRPITAMTSGTAALDDFLGR